MATETAVVTRVHWELNALEPELADLAYVAERWSEYPDDAQIAYALEWSNLMGGLKFLAQAYRCGQMTPDQQARYRELLGKLREALPIIERLDLYRPPVSLET